MNRRGFLGVLVGGVAVAAAARTWPFRVYSFPAVPKVDFGYDEILYGGARGGGKSAIFQLGGIPLYGSTHCPPGRIYLFNRDLPVGEQYRLGHPKTIDELVSKMKVATLYGISV